MNSFSLNQARSQDCLLFECVTGSRAYGTAMPESDTDLRGIFVMPKRLLFGLGTADQVSDATNDETYYEIGRFIDLLTKSNPNILEMLYAPKDCVRFRHPLMDRLLPEWALSKQCRDTFAGYAITQVRKARGLNKKIVNPMDGPRKSVLTFCHVVEGQGSVPLSDWLSARGLRQFDCGLVKIPHMRDVFGIYHDANRELGYRGIVRSEDSTDLILSSIPKGEKPIGWMNFNKDGFKKYCREYREYHDWLANRNEARYATNVAHGRNYDSKNLMHTFRLLDMAEEIASEGRITVRRPNRDYLMQIRRGDFEYEELIAKAEEKIEHIEALFATCDLPEEPDRDALDGALVEIRERWYSEIGTAD
ncbi:MAG: nucleotidyltransferase domain-containing protein [Verrucomicrobiae bacterium]|nr:nucleotidyltransferase domain-containing protein [Verrucomicrobiae bacterium]